MILVDLIQPPTPAPLEPITHPIFGSGPVPESLPQQGVSGGGLYQPYGSGVIFDFSLLKSY